MISRRTSIYGTEDRIILLVGSKFIQVGFSNECKPRAFLPSSTNLSDIYAQVLLSDPKTRKVILIEQTLLSLSKKHEISRSLFKLGVPRFEGYLKSSITFINSDILACTACGARDTGLVIDIGWSCTTIVPVNNLSPLIPSGRFGRFGGQLAVERLAELIVLHCKRDQKPISRESLSDQLLLDIFVKACYVCEDEGVANEQGVYQSSNPDFVYKGFGETICIPAWIQERVYEVFWEGDEDGQSLARLVADCIQKCPIDLRKKLIENVILVGGMAMVPGLYQRLKKQVEKELGTNICIIDCAFKPNVAVWVGASILGAVRATGQSEVLKANYEASAFLPDWSVIVEK